MLDWELRIQAGSKLIEWGIISPSKDDFCSLGDRDDPVYAHLAWLLDYSDGQQFMFSFRESDRVKLQWLLSPYGFTIYKMLVLRKNV